MAKDNTVERWFLAGTVCCTLPSGGQFLVEIQPLEYNEYALKSQGIEAILLI
jgi:hypothetical protein